MTCTLKNWHGHSPTGIASIGFTPDTLFDQLASSGHGKRRIKNGTNTGGPELLLVPITAPKRNSESNSSTSNKAAAIAQGVHERFHSFGSVPTVSNYPPSIEIPLRPASINSKTRRNSKLQIETGVHDEQNEHSNYTALTPRSKNMNNSEKSLHSSQYGESTNSEISSNSECLTIPITDIIVVDTDGSHSQIDTYQVIDLHESHVMYITTMTSGYFEFTFYSKNAQDVMQVFLQSTLPGERITRSRLKSQSSMKSTTLHDTSYDMDLLTTKQLNGIIENETFSERMLSKVQSIFSTFDTITSQFTECVSCDKKKVPMSPTSTVYHRRDMFQDSVNDGQILHARSDVPFLFSYEDSVREAPSPQDDTYISYSVVGETNSDHSSYRSSYSREERWKKISPPPIPLSG